MLSLLVKTTTKRGKANKAYQGKLFLEGPFSIIGQMLYVRKTLILK
jgi:hypothetical protein